MSKSKSKRNTVTNGKKLFEVLFFYTQHGVATEVIEAKNLAEAKRKADKMELEDISDFDPVNGELSVESVEPVEEGNIPAEAGAAAAAAEAETPSITPWLDKVIHGDCKQVLRQLPDASVDMVLTDPPYIVRYSDRSGRQIPNDDNGRWIFPAFAEIYRVMKPDTYCVSFYGWSKLSRFLTAWQEIGFRPFGHFVWVKRYASCTRHTKMKHEQAYLLAKGNPVLPKDPPSDVLDWTYTGNRLHPTQKPVAGLVPLIRAFSRPGAVVLDAFAGSGTTGVAARHCNRHYLLIEQDADYHRIAAERLTHQVPARLI